MRILAVDFGERRIGLAVSDESGTVVVPVGTVHRRSDAQAAKEVTVAAREREVERIVVGHPLLAGGDEGERARRARKFAGRLAAACGLRVDLHPEGLTSVAADALLREAGAGRDRRDGTRDEAAALVLLHDYLSSRPA